MEENALNSPQERRDLLSAREVNVLELAARGLTNREIAAKLGVTIHAVKFHLAAIYRKLGVSNRTGAANLYLLAAREGGSTAPAPTP